MNTPEQAVQIQELQSQLEGLTDQLSQKERLVSGLTRQLANAYAVMGAERMGLGRDDLARQALQRAVSLHTDHADALFNLMLLDHIEGKPADALVKAKWLSEILPNDTLLAEHIQELTAELASGSVES